MRTLYRIAALKSALLFIAGSGTVAASAQDLYYLNQNQTGFNLPGVSLPQGQDEVRAADGTTCRSAVGGSGAYLDVGAIDSTRSNGGNVATYGRVVIPLGHRSNRLDCSRLYALEIQRLEAELELLRMGAGRTVQSSSVEASVSVQSIDWSTEGLRGSR